MATKVDPEIVVGFVKEVEGYLPKMGESVDAYRENPQNMEPLEEAFRMAHIIRGAGSTLGLLALSQIAQFEEDTLESIVSGEMAWSEEVARVLDTTADTIRRYLEGMENGHVAEHELLAEVVHAYRRLRNLPESGDEEEFREILSRIHAQRHAEVSELEEPGEAVRVEARAVETDAVTVDEELWEIFRQEAEEHFAAIGKGLERLKENSWDREALQPVRRSVHTLKGASGIVGLRATSQFAKAVQFYLDDALEGRAACSEEVTELLGQAHELLQAAIRSSGTAEGVAEAMKTLGEIFEGLRVPEAPESLELAEPGDGPAAVSSLVADEITDLDLWETFREEAEGHLRIIGEGLGVLSENAGHREAMEAVRRSIHTLKGASGLVGLRATSQVAKRAQFLLDDIREGKRAWSGAILQLLYDSYDAISESVASETARPGAARMAELESAYDRIPEGKPEETKAAVLGDSVDVAEELWETFRAEGESHVRNIAEGLAAFGEREDRAALESVRRSAHTLKGAAGVVGLRATSGLAKSMQYLFDDLQAGRVRWSEGILQLLRESNEMIAAAIVARGADEGLAARREELEAAYQMVRQSVTETEAAPVVAAPEEVADQVDVAEELWEAFSQEAEEHLHGISQQLRDIGPQGQPVAEQIQVLRRRVHTLKGAAGVVGLRMTSRLAHRMEDLLDALYDQQIGFTSDVAPLLFATFDALTDALAARGIHTAELADRVTSLYGRYDVLMAQAKPEPAEVEWPVAAREIPAKVEAAVAAEVHDDKKQAQWVRAPLERVDEMVRLVSELVIHRSAFEQYLMRYTHEIGELQLSIERLNRVSRKLQSDYEAFAMQETTRRAAFVSFPGVSRFSGGGFGPGGGDDWDALEFDRYTEFHILTRDLAETSGDIASTGSRLNDLIADFDNYLTRQGTLTGQVEDRLMRLRMLPLRNLSSRLHRTVRVTAERRNKQVDLVIEGENVELDKTVLEEMAGPMDHLLRNAVDHGVEAPAVRRALGKAERGTVTVRAFHEGTQVVLQIKDDGGGLDPERLRVDAVRRGYLTEGDAKTLTAQELYSVIFLPGFSTAAELSELSGRGVGLDVVKETVSKLKGTITVSSTKGAGVTFTIRLPMTLALTKVVLVKAGSETVAIPLAAVTRVLRLESGQLERGNRGLMLRLGGKLIPSVHLSEVLGLRQADPLQARLKVLVLNVADQELAVMVDNVLEAREVVVKPLGNLLSRLQLAIGATVLGDGSVVLIMNPNELIQQHYQASSGVRFTLPAPRQAANKPLEVLVVDDSPSVRRVLTNLLHSTGWHPHTGKDGLDALEVLQNTGLVPDVVLLDIEMPRMDGYEFATTLRNMPVYRKIPIIMLTSRSGEKHRKRAFESGANDYLVKPYQDDDLLGTVRRVVADARREAAGLPEPVIPEPTEAPMLGGNE